MSELKDSYRRGPNFRWRFNTVTSLVDFYGFRNMGEWSVEDLDDNLVHEFDKKNLCRERVFPYIQRHEFEGLLFSDTSAFQVIADVDERDVTALTEIRGNFTSPEDINDGYETAPSKCIMRRIRRYDKVVDGLSVAQETGLAKIREECSRFEAWLTRLEQLPLPVRRRFKARSDNADSWLVLNTAVHSGFIDSLK